MILVRILNMFFLICGHNRLYSRGYANLLRTSSVISCTLCMTCAVNQPELDVWRLKRPSSFKQALDAWFWAWNGLSGKALTLDSVAIYHNTGFWYCLEFLPKFSEVYIHMTIRLLCVKDLFDSLTQWPPVWRLVPVLSTLDLQAVRWML